ERGDGPDPRELRRGQAGRARPYPARRVRQRHRPGDARLDHLTGQAAAAAALAVPVTTAASATAKTSITAALSAVKPSTQSASSRRSGPARREPTDLAAVNVNQAARGLPPDVGRWRRVQGGGARLQVAISSAWRMGLAEPAEQVPGPLGGGGARQPLADVQGLMISTPVPSKSSRLRV